ncbi:MAG: putative RNA methyltransferase [bacterium]
MLAELLDVLRCPVCAEPLEKRAATLRCPQRHSFDIARQGYVNLLAGVPSPRATADTGDMVRARDEFLTAGHYHPIAAKLADAAVSELEPAAPATGHEATSEHDDHPVVLDIGAGTGHYAAAVLDRTPRSRGLALDASKSAARYAARAHPRLAAAVWDVWRPWPVRDESVTVLLDVFAPRNPAEFHRVLRPGGAALVVTPTTDHLAELVEPLGMLTVDSRKAERLDQSLATTLTLDDREELTFPLALPTADVERLVRMGPSSWHVDDATLADRLAALDWPVRATASISIARYRKP